MAEKKIIAKISASKDTSRNYLDRQLLKLQAQNLTKFAIDQLVSIAEAKQNNSEVIFGFLLHHCEEA